MPHLEANEEGELAFNTGRPQSNNPYDYGQDDFIEWDDGWLWAQEDFAIGP